MEYLTLAAVLSLTKLGKSVAEVVGLPRKVALLGVASKFVQ